MEVIASGADPFDPARLRLEQDFDAKVGVKKAIVTVPVRKPDRQWFVRVHQSEEWRLTTAVLEVKEDRETYLVDPSLWSELPGDVSPKMLATAVNRQGVVFIWPIRIQGNDGKLDSWNRSALEASQMATKGWVRVAANMTLGAYDVFEATGALPGPEWPDMTFAELLKSRSRTTSSRLSTTLSCGASGASCNADRLARLQGGRAG